MRSPEDIRARARSDGNLGVLKDGNQIAVFVGGVRVDKFFNPWHDEKGRFDFGPGGMMAPEGVAGPEPAGAGNRFSSVEEARKYMMEKYGINFLDHPHFWVNDVKHSMDEINMTLVNRTVNQFDKLAAEYPVNITSVYFMDDEGAFAQVEAIMGPGNQDLPQGVYAPAARWEMRLSSQAFLDHDKTQAQLDKCVAEGFHPEGTNNWEAIVTHEYFHTVYHPLYSPVLESEEYNELRETSREYKQKDPRRSSKQFISKYATFNAAEFIASAATAAMFDPTPSKYAVQTKQWIDKHKKDLQIKELKTFFNPWHDEKGRFDFGPEGVAGPEPGIKHDFKDIEEARKYLEEKLKIPTRLEDQRMFKLPPLDMVAVNRTVEQLEYLEKTYGHNVKSLYIGALDANLMGQCIAGDMKLNHFFMTDWEQTKAKLDEAVASGFHPSGCNTWDSVVTHEYAHAIIFENPKELSLGVGIMRDSELNEIKYNYRKSLESVHKDDLPKTRDFVSYYAQTRDEEWIAESFAQAHHDLTPSEHAVATRDWVKKYWIDIKKPKRAKKYFNPWHDERGRFDFGPGGLMAPEGVGGGQVGGEGPVSHDFKTMKECVEHMRKVMRKRVRIDEDDPRFVRNPGALEAMNDMIARIEYMEKMYPNSRGFIEAIDIDDSLLGHHFASVAGPVTPGTYVTGDDRIGYTLEINTAWFASTLPWQMKDGITDFDSAYVHDEKVGFHPRGSAAMGWDSIVAHEYAHVLTLPDILGGRGGANVYQGEFYTYHNKMDHYVDVEGIQLKNEKFYISKYAEKNVEEFVASSYIESISDPDPSPHAMRVRAEVDRINGRGK